MFKEKVNARTDGRTDGRTDARTTDTGPWHKLAGLRPVELKTSNFSLSHIVFHLFEELSFIFIKS